MEFFNRKEEVLDIELTQYGKYLLSVGKFKPSYYAFFDDDVIYDTQYQGDPPKADDTGISGPTENQKDSQKRIQETPRVKAQHNFHSTDITVKQIEPMAAKTAAPAAGKIAPSEIDAGFVQTTLAVLAKNKSPLDKIPNQINFAYPTNFKDEYYGTSLPLGTSDHNSIYSPAWQLNFVQGQLKSSATHSGGDGDEKYGIKRIPQLEIEVTFNTSNGNQEHVNPEDNIVSEATPGSALAGTNNEIFANGNFVKIVEDYILLDVQELNSIFGKDNFELEAYEIVQEGTSNENLKKLFFAQGGGEIISYENESDFIKAFSSDPDDYTLPEDFVEYYFDVTVDNEIEQVLNYQKTQVNTAVNDLEPCEDDV